MRSITIDPRVFILPPFVQCPKCKHESSFGFLTVWETQLTRRCRVCMHSETTTLPRLEKKIVYLDQFAISDMMKSLKPDEKRSNRDASPFFGKLFRIVDRLAKLQLIVCPSSGLHNDESRVDESFPALKRMYELLSAGCRFVDSSEIENLQIFNHVQLWQLGRPEAPLPVSRDDVLTGHLHGWRPRMHVSVSTEYPEDWLKELRDVREAMSEGYSRLFNNWISGKYSFEDIYRIELRSYGETIFRIFTTNPTPHNLLRVKAATDGLEKSGVSPSDGLVRAMEYFLSPATEYLPSLRIPAILNAALAQEATNGRKKAPSRGMANDIRAIGSFLPYCDAMLLDNECRHLLGSRGARKHLQYSTRIFSQNNADDFLLYLEGIEKEANSAHLQLVEQVYGSDWSMPFERLYDVDKEPEKRHTTDKSTIL